MTDLLKCLLGSGYQSYYTASCFNQLRAVPLKYVLT